MKSHRDAEDGERDLRKLIAQLGTTGDVLVRTLGLDKDATPAWNQMTFSAAASR